MCQLIWIYTVCPLHTGALWVNDFIDVYDVIESNVVYLWWWLYGKQAQAPGGYFFVQNITASEQL
jgi:hypothetical protein